MTTEEEAVNKWDPMKEDFENDQFNSYNRGPGQKLPKKLERGGNIQLYITGIPMEMTEEGLCNLFRPAGMPLGVKKCAPKDPQRGATFGFVSFATVAECESAIRRLHNFKIGSQLLRVTFATPKELRPKRPNPEGDSQWQPQNSTLGNVPSPSNLSSGESQDDGVERHPQGVDSHSTSRTINVIPTGRGALIHKLMDNLPGPSQEPPGLNGSFKNLPPNRVHVNNRPSQLGDVQMAAKQHVDSPGLSVVSDRFDGAAVSKASVINDATPKRLPNQTCQPQSNFVKTTSPQPVSLPTPAALALSAALPSTSSETLKDSAIAVRAASNNVRSRGGTLSPKKVCNHCGRTAGNLSCTKCRTPYCSKNCQSQDWQDHRDHCKVMEQQNEFESRFEVNVPDGIMDDLVRQLLPAGLPSAPVRAVPRTMAASMALGTLLPGTEYKAEICHFENPASFWIQRDDNDHKGALLKMAQELNQLCQDAAVTDEDYTPVKGELCAGKYASDGVWYRVAILGIDMSKLKAKAYFVDYGNEDTIEFSSLCPLATQFTELPQQAIHCALANTEPVRGEWSSGAVLKECIHAGVAPSASCKVQCYSAADDDALAKVTLLIGPGTDLCEFLVKSGVAVAVSTERVVIKTSLHEQLHVGEAVKVCVTAESIVSPDEFSGQVVCERFSTVVSEWQEMSKRLCEAASQQPAGYRFQVNDYVCAPFAGSWYRARIIRFSDNATAELLYVDFGNVDQVSVHEMRPLQADFAQVPSIACACSLGGLAVAKPSQQVQWGKECVAAMVAVVEKATTLDGRVLAKDVSGRLVIDVPALAAAVTSVAVLPCVAAKKESLPPADRSPVTPPRLSSHGGDSPLVSPTRSQQLSSMPQSAPLSVPCSTFDSRSGRLQAVVSFVSTTSLGLFYLHVVSPETTAFTGMVAELQAVCSKAELTPAVRALGELSIGQAVAAKFTVDNTWYRGKVEQVFAERGEVVVSYVDYGNEEVLPLERLRCLPSALCLLPSQATPCRLVGIDGLNPVAVQEHLKRYVEQNVYAQVMSRQGNGVCLVELYEEDGQHVNQQLMLSISPRSTAPSSRNASRLPISPGVALSHARLDAVAVNGQMSPPQKKRHPTLAVNMPAPVPTKDDFVVIVTHVVDCLDFYGQQPSEDFKVLEDAMANFVEGISQSKKMACPILDLTVGEVVVARWSEDGKWYRGVAEEVTVSTVKVFFADFGNSAPVSLVDIRLPTPAVLRVPFRTVHMSLVLPDGVDGTSASVTAQFRHLVEGTASHGHVVQRSGERLMVSLATTDGKNINQLLRPVMLKSSPQAASPGKDASEPRNASEERRRIEATPPSKGPRRNVAEERRQIEAQIAVLQQRLLQLDSEEP